MTPTPTPPNAVILERIDNLRSDIAELKTQVTCINDNQYRFEKTYVERHAEVVTMAEKNKERLDKLEPQVDRLIESIKPWVFQSRIIAWLAGIFGASVIALIWAIITHQVTIAAP